MPQPVLLSESVETYLATISARSAGYAIDVRGTLSALLATIGDLQVRHLTNAHLGRAFDRWQKINSPGTFNKKLGHVARYAAFAHRRHQTQTHPRELLDGISVIRVIPRKKLYLTAPQLIEVLDRAPHPRDRAYLAIAMNTALRAGEMTSLRVADLDLDGGSLHVLRHKTGTRDIMPITADLDTEMRRWLTFYATQTELSGAHFLTPAKEAPPVGYQLRVHGITAAERLACKLLPTTQLGYRDAGRVLRNILTDMELFIDQEGLHTIRRSIARLLYEHLLCDGEARDEALSIVQAMLGHTTQSITERYIGVERFKEARDKAMRGEKFLTAMAPQTNSVRRIHG